MTDPAERARWVQRATDSVRRLPLSGADEYIVVSLRGDERSDLLREAADWLDANWHWAVVHGISFEQDPLSTPGYQVNIRITGDNADY